MVRMFALFNKDLATTTAIRDDRSGANPLFVLQCRLSQAREAPRGRGLDHWLASPPAPVGSRYKSKSRPSDRNSGPVSVDTLGDETNLVLRDPAGDLVSVSGADAIFAVLALANDTLPNEDGESGVDTVIRSVTVIESAVTTPLLELTMRT